MQLTEQARKAARPEERGENKEDTKAAVREVFEDYFGKRPESLSPAAKHAQAKGQYVMQLGIMKFAEADMLQDKAEKSQARADDKNIKGRGERVAC